MKDAETLTRAGEAAGAARLNHVKRSDVPLEFIPADEDEAYAIQGAVTGWLCANGLGPQAGYKVANVSAGMQAHLAKTGGGKFGMTTPIYGPILGGQLHHELAEIDPVENQKTFFECEFGIRIGKGVPPEGRPYTRASIADYIDACMAGIEIVEWSLDKNAYDVPHGHLGIADNGCNRGAVFGPPVTDWQRFDVNSLTARILKNGEEVLRGEASALLGHPFEVAAWLANRVVDHGKQLRKGDHILLGSVGPPVGDLVSGDEIVISWDELGEARVRIN